MDTGFEGPRFPFRERWSWDVVVVVVAILLVRDDGCINAVAVVIVVRMRQQQHVATIMIMRWNVVLDGCDLDGCMIFV